MTDLCNSDTTQDLADIGAHGWRGYSHNAVRLKKLWLQVTLPFHKSISTRIRLTLFIALIVIAIMGAIATTSSVFLLNTFERNVSEATDGMGASHRLEMLLREVERLSDLYKNREDALTLSALHQAITKIDNQFSSLNEHITRRMPDGHFDGLKLVSLALAEWSEIRNAILATPQPAVLMADSIETNTRIKASFTSIRHLVSEFHHHAMDEMRKNLVEGQSLALWTKRAAFGGIIVGFLLLIILSRFVGSSILKPIGQLQEAAEKLSQNDFSHRVKLRNTQDELGQLGQAFNFAATCLQQLYQELERRSTYDGLTGIMNRAAFDERLSVECKSANRHQQPLSLLMVDIDFFKSVNDDYGHQAGDEVLRHVASVLSNTIRPGDIVARYGGEEFVIILPDTDEVHALAVAERIRCDIEEIGFKSAATEKINITVSLGCASQLSPVLLPMNIVKVADDALYEAKQSGRNRVVSAGVLSINEFCDHLQDSAA